MLVVFFILVGLMLVLLQTTIFMPSPLWNFAPDFYFVLVAFLAFRLDLVRSLIILFPLSCALDVLSGTVLGMYSLFCYIGFFLMRFISSKLPFNESLYQIPLIGLCFLAISWTGYIFLQLFDTTGDPVVWSWFVMVIRAVMVALLAMPLFRLFDAIYNYSQRSLLPWNKLRMRSDNRRRRRRTS